MENQSKLQEYLNKIKERADKLSPTEISENKSIKEIRKIMMERKAANIANAERQAKLSNGTSTPIANKELIEKIKQKISESNIRR